MTTRSLPFGIAAALGGAIGYGVNIVYARQAALAGVSPSDLVSFRVLTMLGLVIVVARWMKQDSFPVAAGARLPLLALGALSAAVGLLYLFAVSFVSIGVATTIFYTFPLVILLASPFVEGERLTPLRLGAFALAFTGLVVALGPSLGVLDLRGVIFAGLASLCAAAQFFAAGRASARVPQLTLLFWVHAIVVPVAFAISLVDGAQTSLNTVLAAWFPSAMTVGFYLIGFALQMLAAKHAPAALIGLVFCLEPVVSIITAWFVLGETLSSTQMMGGVLVLTALVAVSVADLTRAKPNTP